MGYRLSEADLEDRFPEIVPGAGVPSRQHVSALLHQLDFHLFYTSPAGWFAQGYALWNHQSNDGYPVQMGDDFWQFNLLAGYRLAQRRIEVTVGLLNLTDRNYQLNPLTLYNELPRERTLMARLRLSF
jgi:outer membrane receptor for ferric coprogen and ferric-rhodotorulic acid